MSGADNKKMETSVASLPVLKLLEKCSSWDVSDLSARKFLFSTVVYTDGQTIFKAQTSYELSEIDSHLDELDGTPINMEHFHPKVGEEQFVKAICPLPENCYVKTPKLLDWTEKDFPLLHDIVLAEARFCEVIMKNPHPNVAKYLGCIQDDGSLTGLCFERYEEEIFDRVTDKGMEGLSVESILRGIQQGIEHIHSLGYCHNDISPGNIMLRSDGIPVIIDFDACQPINAKLGFKQAPFFFRDVNAHLSKPENDFYGLKKIEECLRRGDFANI